MAELSVIIPGRNELFMRQTIDNVIANMRGDTEIISICDGYWPDPPIADHPKVRIIHNTVPVGQRAAVNDGARMSRAKFIMKLDAHCALDQGFDVKLLAPYKSGEIATDVVTVPRMYNLHAFDWVCGVCGARLYQGPTPEKCAACGGTMARDMVWQPKPRTRTDFMRFDNDLKFQYWRQFESRPEAQGEICDLMSFLGACWVMSRHRHAKLGGLDERHGSWGQVGTEVACKAWLSGGRLVVNKRTWFAHMFRTQGGDFSFPYPISGKEVVAARTYSQNLWAKGSWPKAVRKLDFILEKFFPVPGWHEAAR